MSTDTRDPHRIRVMVFVDFWNFQLSVNGLASGFKVDWEQLGPVIAREALNVVDADALISYQGMNVYGSYDPSSKRDENLRRWTSNTLERFPGVQATMIPRQRKLKGPTCPSCHEEMPQCQKCGAE